MSAPSTVQWLRTAAGRVYVGSGRLAAHGARRTTARGRAVYERLAAWVKKSSGVWWLAKVALLLFLASRLRMVAAAVGERVYERAESGALGWLLWTAAALWVVGAYRAGRDGWEPKRRPAPAVGGEEQQGADEAPDQGAEVQPESGSSRPAEPPVSDVALIAAVRDVGTPHAQLKPLAQHLGVTTDAVRAAAQRMAWAVKDVRMQGRSASAGLRWDEVPSPAEVHPSPGVVGAGQSADDNDDDTAAETTGKGFRVVPIGAEGRIVYDPRDTVRHHKVAGQ